MGCQNIDSQIQGDENGAAITGQQTFGDDNGRHHGGHCGDQLSMMASLLPFHQGRPPIILEKHQEAKIHLQKKIFFKKIIFLKF